MTVARKGIFAFAIAGKKVACAYMALIALAGLLVNSIWHIRWADPVAALLLIPIIVFEARESLRGKPCACHSNIAPRRDF